MTDQTIKTRARVSPIPADAITCRTYSQLRELISKWVAGAFKATVIIIGGAGAGKTENTLRAIGETPHLYLKGDATQFGVYASLYQHKDEPVILDDLDQLLKNHSVTGLLKMLLETRETKIIQRTNQATMRAGNADRDMISKVAETVAGGTRYVDVNDIPASFETTSRVCMLCNEITSASANFQAALDRATIIWFRPNAREVARYVATWFDLKNDQDVYDYVTERLDQSIAPSCRLYYKAQTWKHADLNWREMIENVLTGDSRSSLVREIMRDATLTTEKQREAAWIERTGQSRQTYYDVKRAIAIKDGTRSVRSQSISRAMKTRAAKKQSSEASAYPSLRKISKITIYEFTDSVDAQEFRATKPGSWVNAPEFGVYEVHVKEILSDETEGVK